MEQKEFKITANYIGEDTQEVTPPENLLPNMMLEYLYENYQDIKESNKSNEKIAIYDVLDDLANSNLKLALKLYQNILLDFSEYLLSSDTAYYLVDPFLEIFTTLEDFSLLKYLNNHFEIAQLLFSNNCYISDILINCLLELAENNDIENLKKYILLLNQNRYFESNPESLFWEDILDSLKKQVSNKSSLEIKEYIKQLEKTLC